MKPNFTLTITSLLTILFASFQMLALILEKAFAHGNSRSRDRTRYTQAAD